MLQQSAIGFLSTSTILYRTVAFVLFTLSISSSVQSAHYHDDVESFTPWKGGSNLGELNMPVSSKNEQAQQHFQTGMKLVHLYEFPEAMWSFKKAQQLEPTFAMAYWGEMLANQMLIWYSKQPDYAMQAYERMNQYADLKNMTDLEKGLIDATKTLYKEYKNLPPYNLNSSVWKFRKKMQALYQRFPDDPDVKVLYGYSVLGTRRGIRDFKTNRQAAQLFNEVLKTHPKHPGALHYLVHATESPVQSQLGFHAAKSLGDVASGSIHALHMPSHHYFVRGEWQKVIDINIEAWKASWQRAEDLGLSEDTLEYHGYGWVIYAYLQQGQHNKAYQKLKILYELYNKNPTTTKLKYLLFARAGFLVDSPPNSKERKLIREANVTFDGELSSAMAANLYAMAYDSWQAGERQNLDKIVNQYKQLMLKNVEGLAPPDRDAVNIMYQITLGLDKLVRKNDFQAAEYYFDQARKMELNMVHEHGIPLVVKPAIEMYAELLMHQGKENYKEAEYFYKTSLIFQPGRKSSLDGLAKIQATDQ